MQQVERYDVSVIGAGIVGLAHAMILSQRGLKVVVFERSPRPQGASVRNFGLIGTAALHPGPLRDLGLTSRKIWVETINRLNAWCGTAGSVYLAHSELEMQCLAEFTELLSQHKWTGRVVTKDEALQLSPHARPEKLLGGACGTENILVDPFEFLNKLIDELQARGVKFHFNTTVVGVDDGYVGSDHVMIKSDLVLLCTGDDFQTLFPAEFASENWERVKLQMLKLTSRHSDWSLGPAISGALTAYRLRSFSMLASGAEFDRFVEATWPEQVAHGVHALASQDKMGQLVVGDSREPVDHERLFSQDRLDHMILDYLDTLIDCSTLEVQERWLGTYTLPSADLVSRKEVRPGVHSVHISGPQGLTLSFGVAQQFVNEHYGPLGMSAG